MNKRFIFAVAVLMMVTLGCWAYLAYADNADRLDYHTNVRDAVAIADGSSGELVEVSECGELKVRQNHALSRVFSENGWITCNRSFVYAVIYSVDGATAGDHIELKDGDDICGIPRIRLETTADHTNQIFTPAVPIEFSDRIYLDIVTSGGEVNVTIVYTAPDG